ncbi:MAG: hypothetical protein V3V78_02055 [Candidatus Woesearchaeota archaeon]
MIEIVLLKDTELAKFLKETDLAKEENIQKYIQESESEKRSNLHLAKMRILNQEVWAVGKLKEAGTPLSKEDISEIVDYAKTNPEKLNPILYTLVKVYNTLRKNLGEDVIKLILEISNLDQRVIDEINYNKDNEEKVKRANEHLSKGEFELAYKEFKWANALTEEKILEILKGLDDKNLIVNISFKHNVNAPGFDYNEIAKECIEKFWYSLAWKCYIITDNQQGLEKLKEIIKKEAEEYTEE